MKYILAIDGGSQSTKLVLFDFEGRIVCQVAEPLKPMSLPKLGYVEHPDDDLWDSLVAASRKLWGKFDGDRADIIGAGLCSIRFDRVLVKNDGMLAQPALSWMDERVSHPYEHLNPDVAYVTSTNGYLTKRITGKFVDTVSTYQGQWPIDTDKWEWSGDPAVQDHYNIPRKMLFDLAMPGEVIGTVTKDAAEALGLPEGLPIVATGNDKAVEALGTGALSKDSGLVSLGTYICGMVHGEENPKDCKNFWVNFACMPHRYLYESWGVRRGMWLISWFKDLLGQEVTNNAKALGISGEDYLESLAKDVPVGSNGLMIVPEWLAPTGQPFKRGLMIGFDARHQAGHIYRAIMEGIAMTMKNCMDNMCEELGVALEQLTLSGGGSNSDLFTQIFADVFGVPTMRNEVNGAASVGAAICVAVALGVYPDFETAAKKMARIRDCKTPFAANVERYRRINSEVYKNVTSYTDPLLQKALTVFGAE